MDKVRSIQELNEKELALGLHGDASWHAEYKDSAWIYVGGLNSELSEGDVLCVFSQFGEPEEINMPRDIKTGAPRGWCWLKYEDQRSTILAVDNFNGIRFLGKTLRVDHCANYKLPKELKDRDDKFQVGALYKDKEKASHFDDQFRGQDLFDNSYYSESSHENKSKKKKKKKKDKRKKEASSSPSSRRKKKKTQN